MSAWHGTCANEARARLLARAERLHVSTYSRQQAAKHRALLQERARAMRHHPTPTEALLWSALRGKRIGVQFRRQQVIAGCIVDFVARSARLVVEVDGDAYHAQRGAADARRDERLRRAGYRVVRVAASLVARDLGAAVGVVRGALG